ncbi:vitamin K-dependent protein Z isoform X7 [Manis javanica]
MDFGKGIWAAPRAPPGPASTTGPARTASAATPAAAPRATRAGTARWLRTSATRPGRTGVSISAARGRSPTRAAVRRATGWAPTARPASPTRGARVERPAPRASPPRWGAGGLFRRSRGRRGVGTKFHHILLHKSSRSVLKCHLPSKVKLTNSEGKDFCGGVIIQKNFVLTTAKCSLLHRNISVKTSSRRASADPLAIGVKGVHVHMRYEEETGDNDISLLELGRPIQCPDAGLPICVPEKDFAEHVLIPGTGGLLSGWTLHGPELGDVTTQLLVTLMDSEECGRALNATVTTRMYCDRGVAGGSLQWAGGSTVAREHAGTWFLTGILGAVPREEHAGAFLLTKVARYSLWFRQVMSNRAQPAE